MVKLDFKKSERWSELAANDKANNNNKDNEAKTGDLKVHFILNISLD